MATLPIADDAPLGSRHEVENERSTVAFDTARHASHSERVGTGRVSAFIAAHAFLHLTERRVTVAVRTQSVALHHSNRMTLGKTPSSIDTMKSPSALGRVYRPARAPWDSRGFAFIHCGNLAGLGLSHGNPGAKIRFYLNSATTTYNTKLYLQLQYARHCSPFR